MRFARRTRYLTRALLSPFSRTRLPLFSPSPLAGEGGESSRRVRGETSTRGKPYPSPVGEAPTPSPARGEGQDILLTFDDGPHAEHTPAVLDRLAAFGITAAFFLVGNRVTDPALVESIAAAGHTLGNHTFAHAIPCWSDIALSRVDVRKCQELVPDATLFRPPMGRLTPGLWLAARRLKLQCVNWSLDSNDWRCRSEADAMQCAKEVLELVRPGDIVLFHDDHRWIAPILDVVLPELSRRVSFRRRSL